MASSSATLSVRPGRRRPGPRAPRQPARRSSPAGTTTLRAPRARSTPPRSPSAGHRLGRTPDQRLVVDQPIDQQLDQRRRRSRSERGPVVPGDVGVGQGRRRGGRMRSAGSGPAPRRGRSRSRPRARRPTSRGRSASAAGAGRGRRSTAGPPAAARRRSRLVGGRAPGRAGRRAAPASTVVGLLITQPTAVIAAASALGVRCSAAYVSVCSARRCTRISGMLIFTGQTS